MKRYVFASAYLIVTAALVLYAALPNWSVPIKAISITVILGLAGLLQAMFSEQLTFRRREGEPHLRLVCKKETSAESAKEIRLGHQELTLYLKNDGDGIVKFPTVDVGWEPQIGDITATDANECCLDKSDKFIASERRIWKYQGEVDDVVSPDQPLLFMRLWIEGDAVKRNGHHEFCILCDIDAQGMKRVTDEVKLPVEE